MVKAYLVAGGFTMQKKYAQENDQEAIKELARRHMLDRVMNDERIQSRLRGKRPDGDLMDLLVQAAKLGRVPPQRRMDLRELERKYRGVEDERLLAKARRGGLGQRGTRMMRRLIKRDGGGNPEVHRTDQEGTEEA